MTPWIIAGCLYVAGALNMAVMVSDHPNWASWRTVALCTFWPFATVGSLIDSATHGRVRFW